MTAMKNNKSVFAFSGITPDGIHLDGTDHRFNHKALIIDIMGTWCHNCMDAAPLLQQLSVEFKKDGLEVIGLAFEISDQPDVARKNLALFRQRYNITYPLLFCGSTKDATVDSKLRSQLDNFYAYPTTLFIDKKGTVRKIMWDLTDRAQAMFISDRSSSIMIP